MNGRTDGRTNKRTEICTPKSPVQKQVRQKTIFVPLAYRCYVGNMERIGFMASEEMSFENVDDNGRTTDACLYYKLTFEPLAQVS